MSDIMDAIIRLQTECLKASDEPMTEIAMERRTFTAFGAELQARAPSFLVGGRGLTEHDWLSITEVAIFPLGHRVLVRQAERKPPT